MPDPSIGPYNAIIWKADRNPTSSENVVSSINIGDFWLNTSSEELFICTDNTPDDLNWKFLV